MDRKIFTSALPEEKEGIPCDLAEWIAKAYKRGVLAHGDLGLTLECYSIHLAGVLARCVGVCASSRTKIKCLSELHYEDLFLAKACAERGENAWSRFDFLYRKYLNDLIVYLCSLRHVALDLIESIMIDLYLPDRSGHSRIASYDGRSSLGTWLRVVVTNRIINEAQRKSHVGRTRITDDLSDGSTIARLEFRIVTRRYEALICECLKQACANLSPRERSILLWRFERQLQLGDIADRLCVHQSTITRMLERIAKKLKQETIENLRCHHLDGAAIEECLSVLVEHSGHRISILDYIRDGNLQEEARAPALRVESAASASRSFGVSSRG